MLNPIHACSEQRRLFIQEICAHERLFLAFTSNEQYAEIPSRHSQDTSGKPSMVRCFWSNEQQALKACETGAWQGYRVIPQQLIHFLEDWLADMADEGVLAGINFDHHGMGGEIASSDLILEILAELKSLGKALYLRNHDDYDDFANAVKNKRCGMKRTAIVVNPQKIDEIQVHINAHQFSIVLCKPYNDNGVKTIDFSCLAGLTSIKRIILSVNPFATQKMVLTGLAALYTLPNLRELDFDFLSEDWVIAKDEVFDMAKCQNLRRYEGQLAKNMMNLAQCVSLEVLHLRHFNETDFSLLSNLKNLREIRFAQLKCQNTNGLQYLPNLQKIELYLANQLTDISALNNCPKLVQIKTERCPKLNDIRLKSASLQSAWLWHKINNLDFIQDCPQLNHLGFKELVDGNLQPIIDARIANFHFEKKKHYSHGLKELEKLMRDLVVSS